MNVYNNKYAFLNEKPKKLFIAFIIMNVILLILLLLCIKIKIYDNYQAKGYVKCEKTCVIVTIVPSNINIEKIKENNKYLDYEIIKKELKIDEENYISYNNIVLKTDRSYQDKEIIDLNFYYNKQRIIKKIVKKIF